MPNPFLKTYRAFALTAAIAAASSPLVAQSENLDAADNAVRQLPQFDDYPADMRDKPAGYSYLDPVTDNKIVKITSPSYPGPNNKRAYHDYSEGGPYISAQWGDRMHTLLVRHDHASGTSPEGGNFSFWLVDYQRETGSLSRPRMIPEAIMPGANAFAFSTKANEPQMAYVVRDDTGRLEKWNTSTTPMQLVESVQIPGDVAQHQPKWLQVSEGDGKIVFNNYNYITGDSTVFVYASDPQLTLLGQVTRSNIDEPALDRAGNYVLLRRSGDGDNCNSNGNQLEEVWYLWNLQNIATAPVCTGGQYFYAAHTGWVKGYFPSVEVNYTGEAFYYDPATGTRTVTAQHAAPNYFFANHHTAQWLQSVTGTGQWYFGSNDYEGPVVPYGWTQVSGTDVWEGTINWPLSTRFQKHLINAGAAYQYSATDPRRIGHTLTPHSSLASLTAGAPGGVFYDTGTNAVGDEKIYVSIHGGGDPSNKVKLAVPGPVHNGIGARRIDGTGDVKLIAHTYSWPNYTERASRVTVSPDGRLAMFDSTMGWDRQDNPYLANYDQAERTDVFVVEIPRGTSPTNPPPSGGTPVVWTSIVNAVANGSTLTENCNGCGNSGADSTQQVQSGDGYVDFTAASSHDVYSVGLGSGPASTSVADLDYALRFYGNGNVEVRQNGVWVHDTTYALNDRFRIAIEEGDVNFYRLNGTTPALIGSIESPTLQYPIKVEAALFGAATQVAQVEVTQSSGGQSGSGDISWTNLSNAIANGNTLTENCNGCGNAGAQSVESLTGDGYIEFTALEIDTMRAVGLNDQSSNNLHTELDFAIVLRQAGTPQATSAYAEVWQSGSYISDTPYVAGDRFRIAIENGVVKYFKYAGGNLVPLTGTNATASNYPLYVDTALSSAQATVADVTLVPE